MRMDHHIQSTLRPTTVFFVICCGLGIATSTVSSNKLMLCYYVPASYFPVDVVPGDLCSHLVFAFAKVSPAGIIPVNKADLKKYSELVHLKKRNPKLKVLLSLQHGFDSVVDSGPNAMTKFSSNAVNFLKNYGFDGVDLDWEFPRSHQKDNFAKFIQIFSSDLKQVNLLLSAALPNNPYTFKAGYDVETVERSMDLVTVMAYDFHLYLANRDNHTGYNSPLYTPKGELKFLSAASMVEFYLQAGISNSKLLMGVPTYGRSWKLQKLNSHKLHAPSVGKGDPGPIHHLKGIYLYSDVCKSIQLGASQVFDENNGGAYLYDNNSNWVAFESNKTAVLKMSYVKQQNLAGVCIWAITLDDSSGVCLNGPFPLINFIKKLL